MAGSAKARNPRPPRASKGTVDQPTHPHHPRGTPTTERTPADAGLWKEPSRPRAPWTQCGACSRKRAARGSTRRNIQPEPALHIGTLTFHAFAIPHDAVIPAIHLSFERAAKGYAPTRIHAELVKAISVAPMLASRIDESTISKCSRWPVSGVRQATACSAAPASFESRVQRISLRSRRLRCDRALSRPRHVRSGKQQS